MPENETQTGIADGSQGQPSEAIRLLWEGTQKALDESGMDRSDLVALCDIIVRLANHRLLLIEAKASPPISKQIVEQILHYRELASDLLRWASVPVPDPDWSEMSEKLRSVGAPALE